MSMMWLLACVQPDSNPIQESPLDSPIESPADSSQDSSEDSTDSEPVPRQVEPIVVIGAGIAGLSAAMDLAPCTLLEADSAPGGRYRWAGGLMFFAGTEEQEQVGIVDTPEAAFADWEEITGAVGTEEVLKFLEATPALRDRIALMEIGLILQGNESWVGVSRLHQVSGGGQALVDALVQRLPESVELRLSTPVSGIVLEEGRVTGVMAGEEFIPANTVVLASGGFVNRMDLMEPLVPYAEGSWAIGTDGGAQGFALEEATRLALPVTALETIGWYSRTIGIPNALGVPIVFNYVISQPNVLPWVYTDATGLRFTNELRSGSLSLHGAIATHSNVWGLTTQELLEEGVTDAEEPYLSVYPDRLICGASWEEVAEKTGMDQTGILETVALLDAYRAGSQTDPGGREGITFPALSSGTPCAFWPGHDAAKNFGGIQTDASGAIPGFEGLYAIGEAAGMGVSGLGGVWGLDGSSSAVVWSGFRTAAAIRGE
jgi:hypothetical protein